MHSDLGHLLTAVLEDRGLSLRALARVTKVSPTYASKIRRGERPIPAKRLEAFVKALGLEGAAAEDFRVAAALAHVPKPMRDLLIRRITDGR